jgi:hypothetical protein
MILSVNEKSPEKRGFSMKRLTRDWARCTVVVCSYNEFIVPHPPKISTSLPSGGFSCIRHIRQQCGCIRLAQNSTERKIPIRLKVYFGIAGFLFGVVRTGDSDVKPKVTQATIGSESDVPVTLYPQYIYVFG